MHEGEIKQEYYNPKNDFVSQEWSDGVYLCKVYTLGDKQLLAFHFIGQKHFRVPYSQHGVGFSISDKPYWYIIEGRQYRDDAMDGINGNEIDVTSQNEPLPKENKESKPINSRQLIAAFH